MIESSEDFLASLATQPWRPRSLKGRRKESLSVKWRVVLLAAVVLLHALGAMWFLQMLAKRNDAVSGVVLVVNFLDAAPPAPPILVEPVPPPPKKEQKRKKLAPVDHHKTEIASAQPADAARPPIESQQPVPPQPERPEKLQLYDSQGRMRVPDDMLDQIDKQVGDKRVFSYQIPRLDDAKKEFYRNRVLAFESTRFDQYWQPDQDLLTELLTKMVEKTTKEIKIPVPGHPGSKMVCKVSILALGGACGIITNGADYVGPVDDPDTLNAEEERQCAAWWNQIIGAKTQDVWRKTRALYEAQCRKPRERPH